MKDGIFKAMDLMCVLMYDGRPAFDDFFGLPPLHFTSQTSQLISLCGDYWTGVTCDLASRESKLFAVR